MDSQRTPFRYSYFQLTFGQEEAYRQPHLTYERLRRCGYDAIEICPPKGRYGLGVSMEDYLATHLRLKADYGLAVSNVNECWGEMWDPYSPTFKTLTEPKTADLAVAETRSTIDFAAELGAGSVTIATAIHAPITGDNVAEATLVAVDALQAHGRARRESRHAPRLRGHQPPRDGQVREHGRQPPARHRAHRPRRHRHPARLLPRQPGGAGSLRGRHGRAALPLALPLPRLELAHPGLRQDGLPGRHARPHPHRLRGLLHHRDRRPWCPAPTAPRRTASRT